MTEIIEETDEQRIARILLWRTRQALGDAPELMSHMRELIPTPERGETDPHLWSPMRLTPTDDSDDFYAAMVDWVIEWSRRLNTTPTAPAAVAWATRDEIRGFRPNTTPTGALVLTRMQTGWLRDHLDDIAKQDGAVEFMASVVSAIGTCRGRYPIDENRRSRQVSARECPSCHRLTVHADWMGYSITYVDIRCSFCPWVDDNPSPAHLLRWLKTFDETPKPLSQECEVGEHHLDRNGRRRAKRAGRSVGCESLTCQCWCHDWESPEVGRGARTPVVSAPPLVLPPSTSPPDPRVCPVCHLYHPAGACQ